MLVEAARGADPLTLAAAAVELGGANAVLAGATAAHLHGCDAAPSTPVHLLVPYGHRLRTRSGLIVHNGACPDSDRTTVEGLPVLELERAVTDVLCTDHADRALAVLDQALALVGAERRERFRAGIGARLGDRRDPRGTRRAADLLAVATGCAESPGESRLLWQVVDAGYPVPTVNWRLRSPGGRELYRLDLAWVDLRIAIEYHGHAVHSERGAEDLARSDDLRRRGWIVIEVWADDVTNPGRYQRDLDDAFRRRGVDTGHRRERVLRGRTHREPRRRRA